MEKQSSRKKVIIIILLLLLIIVVAIYLFSKNTAETQVNTADNNRTNAANGGVHSSVSETNSEAEAETDTEAQTDTEIQTDTEQSLLADAERYSDTDSNQTDNLQDIHSDTALVQTENMQESDIPEITGNNNLDLSIVDFPESEDNEISSQTANYQYEDEEQDEYHDEEIAEFEPEPEPEEPVIIYVEWPIPDYMVFINGGTFTMGSYMNDPDREDDEMLHQVTVSSFYMSRYEVTQREYEAVMGNNPSYHKGPNMPMENVSWFDAVEYCNRLSIREGLTPVYIVDRTAEGVTVTWDRGANGFRLPTEAEWEYACRAGTTTRYNTGNRITRTRANFFGKGTVNVGRYSPNPWGLYDMHGNVSEWCYDWYGIYDTAARQIDPAGLPSGTNRVIRGGNWVSLSGRARSAYRDHYPPSYYSMNIGFRVVLSNVSRLIPQEISNAP